MLRDFETEDGKCSIRQWTLKCSWRVRDVRRAMERVVVVGTSCSGKTTLARQLAGVLGAPHVELDAIHWMTGWRERPVEEVRRMAVEAAAAERWVMDGNYSAVRNIVWGRATAVVWLNYPFRVVLWRALTRTTRRVVTQEELFSGQPGRLSGSRSSAGIRSSCGRSPATDGCGGSTGAYWTAGDYPHLRVIELRGPAEAYRLVASLCGLSPEPSPS